MHTRKKEQRCVPRKENIRKNYKGMAEHFITVNKQFPNFMKNFLINNGFEGSSNYMLLLP